MRNPPIIFLLEPPGVGKTTLGSWACTELRLQFLNLAEAHFLREHRALPSEDK